MKRLTLSLLAALTFTAAVQAQQQAQRLVLAEEFTNASCPPCAAQNPAFDALLAANASKITSVKYHTNWPGTDPMNAQNPQDAAGRVTYYGVTGVPYCRLDGAVVNGSSYSGAPSNLTQAKIDATWAVPSPYEMQLYHYIPPSNDSVHLSLLIHALSADAGSLVAHLAVIEKHIHYNSAPGSNGEKDFYNVMKKLLPGKNGSVLPATWNAGDYLVLDFAWAFANVYNPAEIAAVAFIQNNADKNVRQAVNSSATPLTPVYATDAAIIRVEDVPLNTCSMYLNPVVTIRNNGSQPLTSLNIRYSVNGEPAQTYVWTGNLASWEKAKISIPEFMFALADQNSLVITAEDPNGQADEYNKNNSVTVSFPKAPAVYRKMQLSLKTDNNPQETTWEIRDENGGLVTASGVITQANTLLNFPIMIPTGGCYTFTVFDAGNNGLCCMQGYGYYQLLDSTGALIGEGDQFGSRVTHAFSIHSAAGMEESVAYGPEIYPNPVDESLRLRFRKTDAADFRVRILTASGMEVYERTFTGLRPGMQELDISTAMLSPGVYFLEAGKNHRNKIVKIKR